MKRLCLVALALLALVMSCPALSEAEDPVAVRVGEIEYPQSLVQFAYTSSLDVVRAFNGEVSDEDRQAILDDTIERLIGIGIIENKLMEIGMYDFTEDELAALQYTAQQQYEQTWQELYDALHDRDAGVTEADVTQWLRDEGYSVDAFYREALTNERELRMLSVYCSDVVVSENDVNAFYMDNYVNPDRERYENDIALYESEIVAKNNEAFFVPEGYRYIKQILLPLPDAVKEELKPYSRRAQAALRDAQREYASLAEAAETAETMEDLLEPQAAYREAKAALQAATDAYIETLQDARGRRGLPAGAQLQGGDQEGRGLFAAAGDGKGHAGRRALHTVRVL